MGNDEKTRVGLLEREREIEDNRPAKKKNTINKKVNSV